MAKKETGLICGRKWSNLWWIFKLRTTGFTKAMNKWEEVNKAVKNTEIYHLSNDVEWIPFNKTGCPFYNVEGVKFCSICTKLISNCRYPKLNPKHWIVKFENKGRCWHWGHNIGTYRSGNEDHQTKDPQRGFSVSSETIQGSDLLFIFQSTHT